MMNLQRGAATAVGDIRGRTLAGVVGVIAVVLGTLALNSPAALATDNQVACGDTAGLIAAVEAADASSGDTITLASNCTYTLETTQAGGDTGLPYLSSDMTIEGNGSTIERDPTASPFRIAAATNGAHVAIDHLTIKDGNNPFGAGLCECGATALTLSHSQLIGNDSTGAGGGLAVFNGTATLDHDQIMDNTASSTGDTYGGGIVIFTGTLTITHSEISHNAASSSGDYVVGGGIYADATTLAIDHTQIDDNSVTGTNAAIAQGGGFVFGGTTTVTHSEVVHNSASAQGGNAAGGGIYGDYGSITRDHTVVNGNTPDNCSSC